MQKKRDCARIRNKEIVQLTDNNFMAAAFKANILKICLFRFFFSLGLIGGVLVPFFTDWGGLSLTQIFILQSWFMLWILLLEVPSGAFADFLGRKHSLVLACVINAAAVLVYASVPNFYVFLLGEVLWAAANAFFSGASEAFVFDTLKEMNETEKSKEVFGRIASFGLAGVMIGAPTGSIIASRFGLRAPMLLMAVPLSAAFVVALTFKEPPITQKSESRQYFNILWSGVKYFYQNKILKVLALDLIFIATIAYFMIWFYQPMLKQAGVDVVYFGVVHAVLAASEILIMNNFVRIEEALGSKRRLIFFSAAITGVIFVIGGLTNFFPIVFVVIVLGGGFGLSRRPLFDSYFNKHIPSSKRATVLSTITMLQTLVLVGANLVVGVLADWSLNNTLVILGIAALVFSFVSRVKEEHLID